jgi:ABC-2 type transport system permease protein
LTQAEHPQGLATAWRLWWDYERERLSGGGPVARATQVYRRRAVLLQLVARGLKIQYSDSLLGYAWSLVEPLLLIAVYWVVFGHVARLNIQHYPLFIASAIMPWLYYNGTLSQATGALRENSGIIRTVALPREIYPLSVVGQQMVEYLLSLPVVFVVGLAYGVPPSRYLAWFPLSLALETVLVAGCAFLLSALNALLRDVQKILRVVLRVTFYLTPIVYPASRIPGGIAGTLYQLNPLVGILELNRAIWYPGLMSSGALAQQATISAVGAVIVFVAGWVVFVSLERQVLKEL